MREQTLVFLIGVTTMLVAYAFLATWCLPRILHTQPRPPAVLAFYVGGTVFTQAVPLLAVIYQRTSEVERVIALAELALAFAWTIHASRRRPTSES